MVKGFLQWVNENAQDGDPIKKLQGLEYLHRTSDLDSETYVRLAIDLLRDSGILPTVSEPYVEVLDDEEPPEDLWQSWAQSWSGPAGEKLVQIRGHIDSVGAGEFSATLDTGMRMDVFLNQEEYDQYEMVMKITVGDRAFTQRARDLMEIAEEWSGSEELLGMILTRAVEDYGHFAIDDLIQNL